MRNNKNHDRKTAVALTLVLLAFSVVLLPRSCSTATPATFRKLQQWEQESRDLVRLSVRAYRLYKHCSQPPVVQADSRQ